MHIHTPTTNRTPRTRKAQCHHHYSSNTDKTSHTSIKPSLQSDNLIDAAFVMLLQRFVECVSDSRTYSQFRQVENPQKILSGSIQAQNLHAQIFQENFSGYKADNEAKHAIHEPHLSIKYTGRGTRLRHITYILQFHGLQEKSTNIMQFFSISHLLPHTERENDVRSRWKGVISAYTENEEEKEILLHFRHSALNTK